MADVVAALVEEPPLPPVAPEEPEGPAEPDVAVGELLLKVPLVAERAVEKPELAPGAETEGTTIPEGVPAGEVTTIG